MTGNLFATNTTSEPESSAKPDLKPVPDTKTRQLEILTLTLGLDTIGRTVTALEQDGKDPEDAQYTVVLDDNSRINLGPVSALMSRPKVQQALLVRVNVAVAQMKTADWQDTIVGIVNGAVTHVQTSESITARAQDWATQYLQQDPPSPDIDAACMARDPYRDPQNRPHLVLSKLAKFVARTTTEQITERKLASALRDAGWTQTALMYHPQGRQTDGKGIGTRTSASYWRAPTDTTEQDNT